MQTALDTRFAVISSNLMMRGALAYFRAHRIRLGDVDLGALAIEIRHRTRSASDQALRDSAQFRTAGEIDLARATFANSLRAEGMVAAVEILARITEKQAA